MRLRVPLEINCCAFLVVLGRCHHCSPSATDTDLCSDRDSRECTPSSPNAHFFGRSPATSSSNGLNRLAVTSSSGSDEGPAPPDQTHNNNTSQEAVDRQELIAKEKTIDAYVNFKR